MVYSALLATFIERVVKPESEALVNRAYWLPNDIPNKRILCKRAFYKMEIANQIQKYLAICITVYAIMALNFYMVSDDPANTEKMKIVTSFFVEMIEISLLADLIRLVAFKIGEDMYISENWYGYRLYLVFPCYGLWSNRDLAFL